MMPHCCFVNARGGLPRPRRGAAAAVRGARQPAKFKPRTRTDSMASRFLLLALAVAAVSAQVPLPPSLLGGIDLTVAAATNRLLDAHGRERVFHGTVTSSGLSMKK